MLLDADEFKRFGDVRLQLRVNGEIRQNMIVEDDILYPPVEALQTLAKFTKLEAGDIVLTGTPVGTALTARGVSHKEGGVDLQAFLSAQTQNPNYLHQGGPAGLTAATLLAQYGIDFWCFTEMKPPTRCPFRGDRRRRRRRRALLPLRLATSRESQYSIGVIRISGSISVNMYIKG